MQSSLPARPGDVTSISQSLHRIAQENCDGVLWLAVDATPASDEPLAEDIQAALDSPIAVTVPLNHSKIDKSLQPRWLPLNTEQAEGSFLLQDSIAQALSELRPSALQQGRGRRIAGWIELDGDIRQAAAHLGRQMIRRHPKGHNCLLRLHDPAVLWAVWPVLTGAQQRELLGPVSKWWLLDPAGELTSMQSRDDGPASSWTLEQWIEIDNITPMNQALRDWSVSASLREPLPHVRQIAMQALRRAQVGGFSHPRDLAAFAVHAITVHPNFDTHPAVRRVLAQRKPDDKYMALIETLTERDWSDVRQSLSSIDGASTSSPFASDR